MQKEIQALTEQLNAELSLANTQLVVHYIENDQEKFDLLMTCVKSSDARTASRAAWVMEKLALKYPYLLTPYLDDLIALLPHMKGDGLKRNVLKMLTLYPVNEEKLGFLYDYAAEVLLSSKERVAAKVHAMQLMYQITALEPDLKPELMAMIESQYDTSSPGYKNRAGKLLKKLSKEIDW